MKRRASGEGGVYERKDHRWEGQLHLGYRDGKRQRKSYYGVTRGEVLAKMRTASRALELGQQPAPEREKVGDFLQRWLTDTARHNVRASTLRGYSVTVRRHLQPEIGHIRLARLTADDLDGLYSRLLDSGLSPKTVRLAHAVIHRALAHAMKRGAVAVNVASIADAPAAPRKEFYCLSPEEASRLLQAALTDPLRALYTLALTAGLRQGEILGLRWKDLNLAEGVLSVQQQCYRLNGGWVFSPPKTAASRRTIVLSGAAVEALHERRLAQNKERLRAKDWEDLDLVFTNSRGRPIEKQNLLRRSFLPLLEKAGLPRVRFHDLRHCCASLMLAAGTNLKVIQGTLGHSSINTTMDVYGHLTPTMQKDAAERLDRLLAANS